MKSELFQGKDIEFCLFYNNRNIKRKMTSDAILAFKEFADKLPKEKRATNNYLFDGDTEDLAKAIDPTWNGALPFTLLVGKNGEVLFRHSGVIDPLALRKKIVEQVWQRSEE